ncbi:MAG: hypothetical protein ACTS8V_00485 [Arsenophonus sp. ER-QC15-MAG3]
MVKSKPMLRYILYRSHANYFKYSSIGTKSIISWNVLAKFENVYLISINISLSIE